MDACQSTRRQASCKPHHAVRKAEFHGVKRQDIKDRGLVILASFEILIAVVLVQKLVVFLVLLKVNVAHPLFLVKIPSQLVLDVDLVVLVLDFA